MICSRTLLALCVGSLASLAPARSQTPSFDKLASKYVYKHEIEVAPADLEWQPFFDRHFVRAPLGLFDLYIERTQLTNKQHAESFQDLAEALLGLQEAWLDWLDGDERARQWRADIKELDGWVSSWKPRTLAQAEPGDLSVSADEDVRAAALRSQMALTSGAPLGIERSEVRAEPIVLMPDRTAFVDFLSFCGWRYPHLQRSFWTPDATQWTNFYVDEYKVLALEFADPSGRGYRSGLSMNKRSATGMAQQVTQLAANSMLDYYFGEAVPPALAGSLSVNLVIDVFGECNTRVDGDLRARRTEAREVFVPGGNPSGGWLPPQSADSRWRESQGKDHFVRALKDSQKKGGKKARDATSKVARFELTDDAERERETIQAPILGSAAAETSPPAEAFQGDYVEFLRAYRSAFVYWLRTDAAGSAKKSKAAFGNMLRGLAQAESAAELEIVIAEAYAAPLSTTDLEKGTLEGDFLRWLRKAR